MDRIDDNINLDIKSTDDNQINFQALISYLISKIWFILIWTALFSLIGFGYSKYIATPKYESISKIYIVNTSDESQVNLTDLQVGSNLVNDYISLMKNRTMLDNVITNLDLDYDYNTLSSMITVTNPSNTRELNLGVISNNPEESQKIANALAKESIEYLPSITGAKAPTLVEKAIFPENPISPNVGKNTLLSAFLGFVISTGYFVVKFVTNDSYRSSDDIQKVYGVMPLASIPEDSKNSYAKKKRKK